MNPHTNPQFHPELTLGVNPMLSHVKILGILHIVFGALGALTGLVILMIFGGIAGIVGAAANPEEAAVAMPIIGLVGTFVTFALLVLSIPTLVAGIGLISFKPWARILTIVLSIFNLTLVPLGTILGVYGLWVLFSKEGTQLFETGRHAVPTYMK